MKCHSPEFSILQNLDRDETRSDPWNGVPNMLYDVVLCFERLFDNPPLQMVDIRRSSGGGGL